MRYSSALFAGALVLAAAFATAASVYAATMDSWGGDIKKVSLGYYTFDEFGLVTQNRVSLAKPKGAITPNTLITTTYAPEPEPLVNMSIKADVNGRFFLITEGTLISDARGASGHTMGMGVLLLDDTLAFNPVSDALEGSGDLIYFTAAVDVAARGSSKNGVESGAAKLGLRFAGAQILTVTDGVPDTDNAVPTKLVLKSLSTRFTQISREPDTFDYTAYGGTWDYVFTPTGGMPVPLDIGVPQAGTLSLNVDSEGNADFDTGNGCGSTYVGWQRGRALSLVSHNESFDSSCLAAGSIMVSFTDATGGSGSLTVIDNSTGQWLTGTLTLARP